MIYLTGSWNEQLAGIPNVGIMKTMATGYNLWKRDVPFAVDNECFNHPEKFDPATFVPWLRTLPLDRCLFAVAPDVVGDAQETLRRSLPVLPLIRETGVRAAFVLQDGAPEIDIPWDELDAVFVGGSTAWRSSRGAYELVQTAKSLGKWTHLGRINSYRALRFAAISGYDSADGTYLAFGPNINTPKLIRWLNG